jgi:chorismate lyase / 3-hydroxybenzoate synthase
LNQNFDARPDGQGPNAGGAVASLAVRHAPARDGSLLSDDRVLGVVGFDTTGANGSDNPRLLHVPLQHLGGPAVEIWHGSRPAQSGSENGIGFACNGDMLLAQLSVDDSRYPSFEAAAFDAHARMRAFIDARGYRYPLRVWNYFQGINDGEGDAERYKQFCIGRARAIESAPDYEHRLPAASAIGSRESGLIIHALAAPVASIQVENPRQTSAFHYPRQYGPRSPTFSRARIITPSADEHLLFLSGTASVVGHETLHQHDCRAQLTETLQNIDTLLEEGSQAAPGRARFDWSRLCTLRVYMRRPEDLPWVRVELEARLGQAAPVIYLVGEICRQDLLIEIEGVFSAPR